MKKVYRVGEDVFIILAFVTFAVGVFLRALRFKELIWGITTNEVIAFSIACLLFSIALSVYDLNVTRR